MPQKTIIPFVSFSTKPQQKRNCDIRVATNQLFLPYAFFWALILVELDADRILTHFHIENLAQLAIYAPPTVRMALASQFFNYLYWIWFCFISGIVFLGSWLCSHDLRNRCRKIKCQHRRTTTAIIMIMIHNCFKSIGSTRALMLNSDRIAWLLNLK